MARVRDTAYWQEDGLWRSVFASLLGYRISKFQPLMPPWVEREVVAKFLLDVPGAAEWLAKRN